MPGKIKVKVLAGRNLPVMDRAADTTDAFVEIKFGGVTHKTDVCRKSLNPHWNSTEWYRFEVDDSELQDEPLQLRLMDHDTYSANDAIGKVVVSLAPLLAREPLQTSQRPAHTGAIMSGWIPVFDTMHGIRGELNIIVKVELFSDFNKFRQSSCGVHFFHCPTVPPGYRATAIHGFVEELIVNDDPEYQWIDKIRTPRASNEARQVAFIKLSNQVQRRVGLKAAELGANAVVGYRHAFDLEGESGVVARAIGTAVTIVALPTPCQPITVPGYTQQQMKKYLDILSTDNESITDLNEYFQTHQDQMHKLLNILHPKLSSNFLDDQDGDDDKDYQLTRQTSVKSYAESVSIYQDDFASQQSLLNIAEDQRNLRKLLNPYDENIEEPTGPFKRIKMFRQSSHGFISKRLASMKSRKNDKQNDDQISLRSNSSDTSRLSMTDLRSEFRKLKKLKKPKFRRSTSSQEGEGIGMASVLARSILHAHTSLACIAETQDSGDSPCSTLRRASESEPAINLSDDEHGVKVIKASPDNDGYLKSIHERDETNLPEIQFSSLKNVADEQTTEGSPRVRKISESCPSTPVPTQKNLLKLPGEDGYFGSLSSAMSGESSEIYSSSDDDDESSDQRTDTERSLETLSSVVKSVLEQKTDPGLIAQMEKKLDHLSKESASTASSSHNAGNTESSRSNSEETSKVISTVEPEKNEHINKEIPHKPVMVPLSAQGTSESSSSHFKFHNPFAHKSVSKSISLPSSPVERKESFMSVRIKQQLSKISKNKMIKSFSHLSLRPKKKEAEKEIPRLSNSASNSDVKSLSPGRDTVLGSPFMSYADLVSICNQPAVESPTSVPTQYFDHKPVNMYIGSEPVSRTSLSGPSSPSKMSITKSDDLHFFVDHKSHKKGSHTEPTSPIALKPTGLLHTAMETILMDKVQSLMIPTSPSCDSETKEKQFFNDINNRLEKFDESKREPSLDPKDCARRLVRQNSIHSSVTDLSPNESQKTSVESETPGAYTSMSAARSVPVLQNLHPVMSGGHGPKLCFLETIPSLPENSFDCSIDDAQPEVAPAENTLEPSIVCNNSHAACPAPCDREKGAGSPRGAHARAESYGGKEQHTPTPLSATMNGSHTSAGTSLNATSAPVGMHRRSSDSDLSITPKGSSLTMSASGTTGATAGAILRPSMNTNNLEMLEYPFLTMTEYPPSFIVHIGGMVSARSVKLMDGGESGSRAAWWAELRTELRAHARALRCTAVLGYTESATICEDVCILSASGTAAVIDLETDFTGDTELNTSIAATQVSSAGEPEPPPALEEADVPPNCALAHVPYSASGMPYRAELAWCGACGRARVPGVLLSTLERPRALAAAGRPCLVTAAAARARRTVGASEPAARDLSDQLPFLEYELHRLLLAKLYMQGANALFGLRTQIAIGERTVVAFASGTGALVAALPPARAPALQPGGAEARDAAELRRALHDALAANRAANGYERAAAVRREPPPELADEPPALELCADKDACVLELDEAEDVETARALAVRRPRRLPAATTARVYGVAIAPAARPHAFAQVWRARLTLGSSGSGGGGAAERHVARALDGIHYKLRRLAPAALADLRFQLDLPEDEMQLLISGVALPLVDPNKPETYSNGTSRSGTGSTASGATSGATSGAAGGAAGGATGGATSGNADDGGETIFSLDEEQMTPPRQNSTEKQSGDEKSLSPAIDQGAGCAWSGIVVTPQSRLSGARCQRWLCALQLLFVRETSSVRELGGLSGLLHTFITEVLAVVRAYTAALGGNALASFYITELMLQENPHKNQGQCLLSVGGDVVHVTY